MGWVLRIAGESRLVRMIPKRRKRPKMNVRPSTVVRSPAHLAWVRGHECILSGLVPRLPDGFFDRPHICGGRMEAHHVYQPGDAKGHKPGDNWTVPVCTDAHEIIGRSLGKRAAEAFYRIDLLAIAAELWKRSPHRVRWERKQEQTNA